MTAASLLHNESRHFRLQPTGLPSLDALLGGGARCGGVYEFCSTAGGGATIAALSCAARAALDGGAALVISTTTEPVGARVLAMLEATAAARARVAGADAHGGARHAFREALPRAAAEFVAAGGGDADAAEAALRADVAGASSREASEAAADVWVAQALDIGRVNAVLDALDVALADPTSPAALKPLRVVVLVGLANVIYPVLGGARNVVGHAALTALGARLHALTHAHAIAALVTNAAVPDKDFGAKEERFGSGGGGGGAPTPMQRAGLGLTWALVPDVSVLISRASTLDGRADVLHASILKDRAPPAVCGENMGSQPGDVITDEL